MAAVAALAVLGLGGTAHADMLHNLNIKIGVSDVAPQESAKISLIGGDVRISNEVVPTVSLEYFFNDHISAELMCCAAQHDVKAVNTALGTVNLGQITHFPPTVTAKYHFTSLGDVQPYIGAGVNYTHFFNESLPAGGPVTHISYGDSFGPALQAGVDIKRGDHWSVFADARKIWINTKVKIDAGPTRINADTDIDPWVITAGVGYRF